MRFTKAQVAQIETSWHFNAHNREDGPEACHCDEPPERCPGDCGEVYPFGLLQGKPCGDCQQEATR